MDESVPLGKAEGDRQRVVNSMNHDPLQELHQKLRFPPCMGGNREQVTVPCRFLARLLVICRGYESLLGLPDSVDPAPGTRRNLEREMEWLRAEAASIQRPVITMSPPQPKG